ncbi:MAG: porin [Burkholderiaceae bacterium]
MNKLIVATAVAAAFASPVLAQSSVSVYGRLNVTVESTTAGDGDRQGEVKDNASRIGFKGTEDLGSGLKAGFQIEHGFNADTGTARSATAFWNRQAEVNLSGGFGTVRLGSWTPDSYFATSDYIGMHNHETGDSSDAFYTATFTQTNKVGYVSPNLSGFQFYAAVAEGSATVKKDYDVAAYYDRGALHLGGGFEKQGDFKQFAVRGLYELGNTTLGAYVQRVTNTPLGDATHFRVSAMYTLGASEFHVNVGRAGEYSDLDKSDALQYTLGYNYNLSKRTKVYGYYTRIDKDDVLNVYGGDFDALAIGIRHNF